MSNPYVGEIRLFAGSFAPAGWMFCDGQLLPISENETLFNLIGTTYGGDGQSTFGLPDLRSRVPIHRGPNHQLAESGGVESVTVTINQTPTHNHAFLASLNPASIASPQDTVLAESSAINMWINDPPSAQLAPNAVTPVGGSQPHENMQPFLVISFIISLFGIFPHQ
jgi:microcystin-dependent protein